MVIALAIKSMWTFWGLVKVYFEINIDVNMNVVNNYFLNLILNCKDIL